METNEGKDVERSDADEEKVKIGVEDIGFFIIRIIGCLCILGGIAFALYLGGISRFTSLISGKSLPIGETIEIVLLLSAPLIVGVILLKITAKYKFAIFAKKIREVASKHSNLADAFTKKRDVVDILLDVAIAVIATYSVLSILVFLLQIVFPLALAKVGVAKIIQYSFSFITSGLGMLSLWALLPYLVDVVIFLFCIKFAVRWFKGCDVNTMSGWLVSLIVVIRGGASFITSMINIIGGDPNMSVYLSFGLLGLMLCASAVGMFYALIFRPIRRTGKNSNKDKSTDKTAGGRIESMEDAGGGNGVKVEEKKKELPPLLSAEPEEPKQKPNIVAEAPMILHDHVAETSAQPEGPATPTATAA